MPSLTLAQAAALTQDELVQGVIEHIITVNESFDDMPFDLVNGASVAYNRENVLGNVQVLGVGSPITAKAPTTYTEINDRSFLHVSFVDVPTSDSITPKMALWRGWLGCYGKSPF